MIDNKPNLLFCQPILLHFHQKLYLLSMTLKPNTEMIFMKVALVNLGFK